MDALYSSTIFTPSQGYDTPFFEGLESFVQESARQDHDESPVDLKLYTDNAAEPSNATGEDHPCFKRSRTRSGSTQIHDEDEQDVGEEVEEPENEGDQHIGEEAEEPDNEGELVFEAKRMIFSYIDGTKLKSVYVTAQIQPFNGVICLSCGHQISEGEQYAYRILNGVTHRYHATLFCVIPEAKKTKEKWWLRA